MQSGWAGKLRLCLPLFPCVRHMFNLVCRQSRVRRERERGAEREQDRQLSNVLLLLAIAVWPQTLQLAIAIV